MRLQVFHSSRPKSNRSGFLFFCVLSKTGRVVSYWSLKVALGDVHTVPSNQTQAHRPSCARNYLKLFLQGNDGGQSRHRTLMSVSTVRILWPVFTQKLSGNIKSSDQNQQVLEPCLDKARSFSAKAVHSSPPLFRSGRLGELSNDLRIVERLFGFL